MLLAKRQENRTLNLICCVLSEYCGWGSKNETFPELDDCSCGRGHNLFYFNLILQPKSANLKLQYCTFMQIM